MYFIYILTNRTNSALYIGSTSDLIRRVYIHKEHLISKAHTSKYNHTKLVYYEIYDNSLAALTRQRQLKKWNRTWKRELITKFNPNWHDLYDEITKL